jgi:cellulose synthase/poly-beta-1,6-N-acetylglucosamine synthase-like glycosyltransferase
MKILFWFSCAVIAYTYLGYPLYIWAKSLVAPRPWKQAEIYPTVTVIMAVHNGAAIIWQKIEHLLSLDYPADKYDVIVVSDGSNDGTNDILQGITDPRLRTIICPEHVGKAVALNHGMRAAAGEILLFVDIRPWLEKSAVRQLVSNFADESVGCATGELRLKHEGQDASTKAVGGLYWRYEQWIRNCEAWVDSPLGVYGGFYAIRREVAADFPEGIILDDMYQPLSIIRQGYRSVLDEKAQVIDAWPSTAAGEFHRKVRTLAGNFQLIQLAPWLLSGENRLRVELISHKLLRLTVPAVLLFTLVTSFLLRDAAAYLMIFVAQVAFYCLAMAGWKSRALGRITGPASAFVMLNAAAAVGLCKFMTHGQDLWKIWGRPAEPSYVVSNAHRSQVATKI